MLSEKELSLVLEQALEEKGDFAEIFLEDTEENQIQAKEKTVTGIKNVRTFGAGIYLLDGENSIYVYSNEVTFDNLMKMAKDAAGLLTAAKKKKQVERVQLTMPPGVLYPITGSASRNYENKIRAIFDAEAAARSLGISVPNIETAYFDTDQRIRIANSEGMLKDDRRTTSRFRVIAAVGDGVHNYARWEDVFRKGTFEEMEASGAHIFMVQDLIQRMENARNGRPVKKCTVPVVMEAGEGTFFHECCGHMLEACAIASKESPFCNMIGQQIASEKVTLVDDGTLAGELGTAAMDDEGHATQRNVLIENGVLKQYMTDRLHTRILGIEGNGCGRRQNYTYAPTCRMSNTFALPGNDDDEAMIRDIDEGLYIKRISGGNGGHQFTITACDAFWIEKGEITYPVKELALTGNGIDVMKKIDRVGTYLGGYEGAFCGAESGLIPTTTNAPSIRISEMNLG